LRPLLVVLGAEAVGGSAESAMPAACAVEMCTPTRDSRRSAGDGRRRFAPRSPTVHKEFGEALAILAGDALLTLAFQVLASDYPPATPQPAAANWRSPPGRRG